jgi:hypothetical protein
MMWITVTNSKENPGSGLDRARGKYFNFDWWRQSHAKNSIFKVAAQGRP